MIAEMEPFWAYSLTFVHVFKCNCIMHVCLMIFLQNSALLYTISCNFSCKGRPSSFDFESYIGVGKTSLVHLIVNGSSTARPPQTVGCSVGVKVRTTVTLYLKEGRAIVENWSLLCLYYYCFIQHTTYGNSGSSSSSIKGDAEREFFIELWDICGHDRYKECRSLFYSQINGKLRNVILSMYFFIYEINMYALNIFASLGECMFYVSTMQWAQKMLNRNYVKSCYNMVITIMVGHNLLTVSRHQFSCIASY